MIYAYIYLVLLAAIVTVFQIVLLVQKIWREMEEYQGQKRLVLMFVLDVFNNAFFYGILACVIFFNNLSGIRGFVMIAGLLIWFISSYLYIHLFRAVTMAKNFESK